MSFKFPFNFTGLAGSAGGTVPSASDTRNGVSVGSSTGTLVVPTSTDVKSGVTFDNGTVGSLSAAQGGLHWDPSAPEAWA